MSKEAKIVKNDFGKLYIIIGSKEIRCQDKTELRKKAGEFIKSL